jgi:hypothetical protein
MQLLPDEQRAKDFVSTIGYDRAARLLNLISSRIDRRIRKGNEAMCVQFLDNTCVRKEKWEVALIFDLKMGLQLLNRTSFAVNDHRNRVIARRKARRASAKLRHLSHPQI